MLDTVVLQRLLVLFRLIPTHGPTCPRGPVGALMRPAPRDGVAECVIADHGSFVPGRVIILQIDGHIA